MDSIVCKVKYGETLRRFNIAISGDQRLDLSMEGLKLKICLLFNLPSDADLLRLTYIDEDEDMVTLVDDDDLHDVVKQGLDPVRITVHLHSHWSDQSSSAAPNGSVAQNLPFPQIINPIDFSQCLQNGNSSTPNPQHSTSTDAAKIMKSFQDNVIYEYVAGKSGVTSVTRHVKVGNDSNDNPVVALDKTKNGNCEFYSNKMCKTGGMKKNNDVSSREKDASKTESIRDALESIKKIGYKSVVEAVPLRECPFSGVDQVFHSGFDQCLKQTQSSNRSFNKSDSLSSVVHNGITCDGCELVPITGPRFKSKVRYDYDLCSNCFSEMGNDADYTRIDFPLMYIHPQCFNAPHAAYDFPIIHKGIECDGCGSLPIVGQRFKSKVKHDYDLCPTCFDQMGNDTDYTKIDYPVTCKLSQLPYVIPSLHSNRQLLKKLRPRLNSFFIKDVNVMDGTIMAPSTPFTKKWRICNNGTLPWNRGLQLLWIGGDRFRDSDSVVIQVPSSGVDIGMELDIAVDFIAPELPGHYISYWRMADSCGHKFGQRVWVQIQVDHSVDLTRESSPVPNLNLPPSSNETAFPQVLDVKIEPRFDINVPELLDQTIQMESPDFPVNYDFLVSRIMANPSSGLAASLVPPPAASTDKPGSPVAPASDSYPEDSSHVLEAAAPLVSYPIADYKFGESSTTPSSVQIDNNTLDKSINLEQIDEKAEVEEKLMKELEQMGFKQIDLNISPENEDEWEHSEDDLCDDVAEWDPILEELKEMGFEDKHTNQMLLAKNNGSISRVVMDLIAEEKA